MSLAQNVKPSLGDWNLISDLDIENMTLKTGNFKKFQLFVEMLFSGLDKSTNTISMDILTMKDLQQKGKDNVQQRASEAEGFGSSHELDTKLYLIVTYAVAFDRYVSILSYLMSVEFIILYHLSCKMKSHTLNYIPNTCKLKKIA